MKRSSVIILNSSEYGAIEIKKYINKSTIRGYFVALLIMLSVMFAMYFVKEHIVIVPRVLPPNTIPLDIIKFSEPKLPQSQLNNEPKLADFKSVEVAGKYTPIDDDKIDPKAPDIASIENQYEELQMSVVYPETARKAGIQGQVVVQALIGKDGKVLKTRILSTENKYLNEAAEKAIFNFKGFSPAIQSKTTVAVWIAIPIKFKL
ncbi:MAG: energy transducer TonB [Candidatus Kapabacteria bacterium]|nr:energy transducer TonB [Candidatus Kapabacteria bacterium]